VCLLACLPRLLVAARALPSRGGNSAKDYKAVLKHYCNAGIARHYDDLRPEAQARMLEALQATVELRLFNEHADGEPGDQPPRADCLLTKVLSRRVSPSAIRYGDIEFLTTNILPMWGVSNAKWIELLKYEQALKFRRKQENEHDCKDLIMSTGSARLPALPRSGGRDWAALQAIPIGELPMFETAVGRVLAGTLIVEPMTALGVTTILEDDWGDIVKLGLYNALPGGVTGGEAWALAAKVFPKGLRLRIAEPYAKIFADGSRGVRVDDPADLLAEGGSLVKDLAAVKEEGNRLFAGGNFHAAADAYWRGVRDGGGDVAVLLSNRAQASIKQQRWAAAVQDAAAAILLDPMQSKAWSRYVAALHGLGFDEAAARARAVRGRGQADEEAHGVGSARELLWAVLPELWALPVTQGGDGVPEDLKDQGNRAYREGRYDDAEVLYTLALSASPAAGAVAVLLSNLAQCTTNTGALHDAVAVSAASMRLRPTGKAVHRLAKAIALLGECELAETLLGSALEETGEGFVGAARRALETLRDDIRKARFMDGGRINVRHPPDLVMDWYARAALEVADMGDKGRGIRATRDIPAFEMVIVQRPRVSHGGRRQPPTYDVGRFRFQDTGQRQRHAAEGAADFGSQRGRSARLNRGRAVRWERHASADGAAGLDARSLEFEGVALAQAASGLFPALGARGGGECPGGRGGRYELPRHSAWRGGVEVQGHAPLSRRVLTEPRHVADMRAPPDRPQGAGDRDGHSDRTARRGRRGADHQLRRR